MAALQLSEDQYVILIQEKAAFAELEEHGAVKGLKRGWLKQMGRIHEEVFKATVCLTCNTQIAAAMTRLHRKMKAYEVETERKQFIAEVGKRRNNSKGSGAATEPKG